MIEQKKYVKWKILEYGHGSTIVDLQGSELNFYELNFLGLVTFNLIGASVEFWISAFKFSDGFWMIKGTLEVSKWRLNKGKVYWNYLQISLCLQIFKFSRSFQNFLIFSKLLIIFQKFPKLKKFPEKSDKKI